MVFARLVHCGTQQTVRGAAAGERVALFAVRRCETSCVDMPTTKVDVQPRTGEEDDAEVKNSHIRYPVYVIGKNNYSQLGLYHVDPSVGHIDQHCAPQILPPAPAINRSTSSSSNIYPRGRSLQVSSLLRFMELHSTNAKWARRDCDIGTSHAGAVYCTPDCTCISPEHQRLYLLIIGLRTHMLPRLNQFGVKSLESTCTQIMKQIKRKVMESVGAVNCTRVPVFDSKQTSNV